MYEDLRTSLSIDMVADEEIQRDFSFAAWKKRAKETRELVIALIQKSKEKWENKNSDPYVEIRKTLRPDLV